jgi:Bifunctional DNA primase/polymerase, N-terminal
MTATQNGTRPRGPYAEAAVGYLKAGWAGPIPVQGKSPPITGYTGKEGAFPSFADVSAWIEGPQGDLNVALRLPTHVVGIDIDCWANKAGASTITDREHRWGPLPATPYSTSREDGSRIQLYRVPEGLVWPGDLGEGSGVDIIQHRHRYVVCAPSRHPDTGAIYTWFHSDGAVMERPPVVDELAELPEAWVTELTSGQAEEQRAPRGQSPNVGISNHVGHHDGPIAYGSRHTALVSYAGSLRRRGLRIDEAEVLMLRRLEDCAQPPAAPTPVTRVEALVLQPHLG